MAIDQNTTHMNDFSKGMNTDVSDAFIEKSLYRLANNLRYITNTEENSGELHMIEGASLLTLLEEGTVLAATQLRDLGIIVAKNSYIMRDRDKIPNHDSDEPRELDWYKDHNWQVWTMTNGSNRLRLVADIKNGRGVHEVDRVVGAKKLSLVTKWEDDDNGKLYIADGLGPIISIPLIPKQQPRTTSDIVIDSLDKIVAYPAVNFGTPKFCGLIDGHLKAGMYEYSYQFYVKNGPQTEISPSTKLIPLHNGGLKIEGSVKGYESGAKTDKGIKIRIPLDPDHNYDRLKIYRICYEEVGVPPIIGVIFDDVIQPYTANSTVAASRSRGGGFELDRREEDRNREYYEGEDDMPYSKGSSNGGGSSNNTESPTNNGLQPYNPYIEDPVEPIVVPDEPKPDLPKPDLPKQESKTVTQDPVGSYHEFCDTGKELLSVVTLEEYNMMTGIHIIPKTIESMTDYMFASNIKSDNPIYDNTEWDPKGNVTWEFVTTELLGDYNDKDDKITITGVNNFVNIVNDYKLDRFIGGDVDKNSSYANPFVSYCLKSLRRGETYRYGIILYDKWGSTTAVKHITDNKGNDVVVPEIVDGHGAFSYKDKKLYVYPVGIKFNVTLPDWAVGYEIVRCGKDSSNMSTIMQCVISRPIYRVYDIDSADKKGKKRPESITTPLTPTGFVTNMDCWYGVSFDNCHTIYDETYARNADNSQATWSATNSVINESTTSEKIQGNQRIFLIISPEYCYMQETIKDLMYKNNMTIDPILYIYPQKENTLLYNAGESTEIVDVTNIGNEWARVIIKDLHRSNSSNTKALCINTAEQVIFCYYSDGIHPFGAISGDDDFEINQVLKKSRYEYIKLYKSTNIPQRNDTKDIKITSTGFPDSIAWDEFATPVEDWQLKYIDKVSAVGGRNFCNWVCGGLYGLIHDQEIIGHDRFTNVAPDDKSGLQDTCKIGGMMGPGGKCMVAAVDNDYLAKVPGDCIMGTYLCNIKQAGGGYPEDAKYSTYRSYGNYFSKDVTDAYVFDGDCFIQPFEYISQHKWAHPYLSNHRDAMIVYSIPMETSINLAYTHGYEFSKHKDAGSGNITMTLVNPSNVNNSLIQDTPLYAYNSVYSANSTSKTKIAEGSQEDDWFDRDQDYRVYNSVAKSNDEFIDNWLKFLPANFLDVDTRYGEITGLRKFNNNLVFWQETAAGLLSVNERVQITDDANMPLTLGTADVLSRYDYINTSNGMRVDEYADTQSDTTLYWWDHNKHEIIGYSGGTQAVSVSKSKLVQNLLNRMYSADWLIDKPILWHDKQYNEVAFGVSDGENEYKGSLIFGENVGAFTALYTILPKAAITFKDSTILINNNGGIYKWNRDVVSSKQFVQGIEGIDDLLYPYLKYVVNSNSVYTKTFDNVEFGGYVYGGSKTIRWDASQRLHEPDYRYTESRTYSDGRMSINYPDIAIPNPMNNLSFTFTTPLKLKGVITGDKIDNTEYNFRFAIPRDQGSTLPDTHTYSGGYGGRLKGKTMLAELRSTSSEYDFSLQYILTKYRISWS